jgi:hypothetical protein
LKEEDSQKAADFFTLWNSGFVPTNKPDAKRITKFCTKQVDTEAS